MLTLAAIAALAAPASGFWNGVAAGACVALMLAVGMETLPYVAVAGLYVAMRLLVGGRPQAALACGFGAAFSLAAAAAFVATVPAGALAGGRVRRILDPAIRDRGDRRRRPGGGRRHRRTASGVLPCGSPRSLAVGVVAAATIVLLFPQCLADPYAGLDPRLKTFWLSAIVEAQPVWSVLKNNPAMAASYYVTPLIGLVLLVAKLRRDGVSRPALLVAAFLAAAVAVSAWQVRGSMFAIPLATVPLAAWVGCMAPARRGRRIVGNAEDGARLAGFAQRRLERVGQCARRRARRAALARRGAIVGRSCDNASDLAALAALPATTVLAISNLGAPILAHTHHRVLAGPYHRNVAGNLLALQAFMGSDAAGRRDRRRQRRRAGRAVPRQRRDQRLVRVGAVRVHRVAVRRNGAALACARTGRRRRDARNLSHLEAALIAQHGITLRNADRPKNRGAAQAYRRPIYFTRYVS